ncbi:spore germination protein, partial [Frankia sp. Cj3]|uniref:spore germination protein n=2 Tax=unclassified Frankia TaxID=2632575 RepID=UPI001EF4B877
ENRTRRLDPADACSRPGDSPMPRYYYRSPLGTITRWIAGTAALILFFTGLQWVLVELLPTILPFLLVGILVVTVFWAVNQLR